MAVTIFKRSKTALWNLTRVTYQGLPAVFIKNEMTGRWIFFSKMASEMHVAPQIS